MKEICFVWCTIARRIVCVIQVCLSVSQYTFVSNIINTFSRICLCAKIPLLGSVLNIKVYTIVESVHHCLIPTEKPYQQKIEVRQMLCNKYVYKFCRKTISKSKATPFAKLSSDNAETVHPIFHYCIGNNSNTQVHKTEKDTNSI